uniref:Uncharacterized protein n=1 Tax=Ditylenchus dipsaci TaxID=166011 RepID=A0A915CR71_9BILA
MALRQKRHKKQMEAAQNITPKSDSLMSSSQFGSDVCRTVHSLEQKQLVPQFLYLTLKLLLNILKMSGQEFAGDCVYFNASNSNGCKSAWSGHVHQLRTAILLECTKPAFNYPLPNQICFQPLRRAYERVENPIYWSFDQQDQCPEPKINIIGKTKEEGKEAFESGQIEMVSMRDHTITRFRRWNQLRRYIMMIYHLEDGTCIHTSLISMPEVVFSHLQFGYVITPEKHKLAVDSINLHLVDIGETNTSQHSFSTLSGNREPFFKGYRHRPQ